MSNGYGHLCQTPVVYEVFAGFHPYPAACCDTQYSVIYSDLCRLQHELGFRI